MNGILPDHEIGRLAELGMITPFIGAQVRTLKGKPCVSFGLGSYGYDIRLGDHFKLPSGRTGGYFLLDPHEPGRMEWAGLYADQVTIEPGETILGVSVEHFVMPPDVMAICTGKSTYARLGVHVLTTPLEAGWVGNLTIEIANLTQFPAVVYAHEGIAQLVFFRGEPCSVTYSDRQGKYQNQGNEPVEARI